MAGFKGKRAVACRRLSASLGIAQNRRSGLNVVAHSFHDGSKTHSADRLALIALLAMAVEEGVHVKGLHGFPAAFCHNDGGAGIALGQLLIQSLGDILHAPRHFRHQHDFRSCGNSSRQCNVAAVTAHDFNHSRAVMASGGRADGAHRVDADVDGCVIAQCHFRIGQVVVNRSGNADAVDAQLAQVLSTVETAVTADDHQTFNLHGTQGIGCDFTPCGIKEFHAARRAQIGTGAVCDVQHRIKMHFFHIIVETGRFAQKSIVSALDADELHAVTVRKFCNGHDCRIHTRCIAAACQNTYFSHELFPPNDYPDNGTSCSAFVCRIHCRCKYSIASRQ